MPTQTTTPARQGRRHPDTASATVVFPALAPKPASPEASKRLAELNERIARLRTTDPVDPE